MKFIISRVSGGTPPCEGAVSEKITHTYSQKCHFSDKLNASLRCIKKYNHTYRIEDGFHKWGVTLNKWVIEIPTLEDLVVLQEKVGDLILDTESGHPHLKIYDDYVE